MIGLSFDKITWWSGREGPRFSYIVRTGSSLQLSWEQDVHHDYSDDDVDEDEDDLTGWQFPSCPESSSWPRRRARCRSSPPPGWSSTAWSTWKLLGKVQKKLDKSGFWGNWPEKESYETSIAENHLENRGHRNCSLDLPHSHLVTVTYFLFSACGRVV